MLLVLFLFLEVLLYFNNLYDAVCLNLISLASMVAYTVALYSNLLHRGYSQRLDVVLAGMLSLELLIYFQSLNCSR